jgi:peptide/nickel transport system ATP-binding protein
MAGSGTAHLRPADQTLLRIEDLVVEFPVGRTGLKVNAVSSVSIDVLPGETLGLVGESGCGKSTMGKAVMQLVHAQSGSVTFEGNDLTQLSGDRLRALRPKLQMIFQDPISSLNPRRRVRDIVREGLDIWKIGDKASRNARVNEVLDTVGIDPEVAGPKRPHEFSGGQCQRISIARAVATEPTLIICDEPVSALDVSVQAQILNLLQEMKTKYGLTMIFIAHDLAVVKNVSDRVAVMYLGKLCEFAQPDELYSAPAHPYTAALLSAIPEPDPNAATTARGGVGGEIPSPLSPPSGCRFRTRCPSAQERCASEEPTMREIRPGHFVACHFPLGDVAVAAPATTTTADETAPSAASPAAAAVAPVVGAAAEPTPAAPPLPPVAPVTSSPPLAPPPPAEPPTAAAPPVTAPPPLRPPSIDRPGPGVGAAGAALAGAALAGGALAAGAAARGQDDAPAEPASSAPAPPTPAPPTDGGWIAPPIAPVGADEPAPSATTREPDDAWLRSPSTPAAADEAPAAVDWTPVNEPVPPTVVPPPAPPEPATASEPEPAVDVREDPPATEPHSIPDVASLDTLLPDRSKGGSINPGR